MTLLPSRSDLLDRIYDACLEDIGFARLGSLLAEATTSANGVVVIRNGMIPVDAATTTPAEAQAAYLAYYGYIDPWAQIALQAPHWQIASSEKFISDNDLLRNEFYVDYARHLDMYHPMGATCPLGEDLTLTVGVNRARTAPAFSEEDKRLLQALLKHVQRALQLRRRFDTLVTQADAGTAALDRVGFGVVVADAEGRTILINSAAAALCRANVGLRCKGDKISAVAASETLQFLLLIRDAAQGGPGGAMQITDPSGERGLLALISPLPRRFDDAGEGYGRALIALRRSGGSPGFAEGVLIELFGLSRAEAQVVRALVEGAGLEAVAAQRGVKVSTLRTQLESIFRKTGAENQRDLLRLLGSLPQIR